MSARNTSPAFAIGGVSIAAKRSVKIRREYSRLRSETRTGTVSEIREVRSVPTVGSLAEGLTILKSTRDIRLAKYTDGLGRRWILYGYSIAGSEVRIFARSETGGDHSTFTIAISE